MNTNSQASGLQKQHDLQLDLVLELLKMDDDATELDAAARARLTELKQLSLALQRAPFDEGTEVSTLSDADAFWTDCFRCLPTSLPFPGWPDPGRGANLFNVSGAPIVVRTFDQRDTLRWIPFATYTIAPNTCGRIYARADSHLQADIRGQVLRVPVGSWAAWDGSTLRIR